MSKGLILTAAVLFLSIVLGLKLGAVDNPSVEILAELRLPRIILAAAIGMGLAVSGAVLQAIFGNPLCEPYTLGISSGAALGAVIGLSLGLTWSFAGLAGTAFIGALVFAGILIGISLKIKDTTFSLLLSGIMLSFMGSGLVTLWLALSDPNGVYAVISWLLGDLSRADPVGASTAVIMITVLSIGIWFQSRHLDGFLLGEEGAQSLGIPVAKSRRLLILQTSLIVGVCVSAGGVIGFIGLVVPHFVRFSIGSSHRKLLPYTAVWGATGLIIADTISRVVARPIELPVGVITSLVGAPLFLWMVLRPRGRSA